MSSPFILFAQRGHSHKIKGEAMKEKPPLAFKHLFYSPIFLI
jgi:hypothetical protein